MNERGFTKEEIEILLTGMAGSLSAPSHRDPEVYLYMGFVFQKGIVIIVNEKTKILITVRVMRVKYI